jgi:hypothetical protein
MKNTIRYAGMMSKFYNLKVAAVVGSMKNSGQVVCLVNRFVKTNLEMSLI